MEIQLDLTSFISHLRGSEEYNGIPDFLDTKGEKYIYNNIVQKCVMGKPVYPEEIDFNAFDEDDIVEIFDEKQNEICNEFYSVGTIIDTFEKTVPEKMKERRFF